MKKSLRTLSVRAVRKTYDRDATHRDAKVIKEEDMLYSLADWKNMERAGFENLLQQNQELVRLEDATEEPTVSKPKKDISEVHDIEVLKKEAKIALEKGDFEAALEYYEAVQAEKDSVWVKTKIKECKTEIDKK